MTAQGLFTGSGRALNDDVDDEDQKKVGAGFRKQAHRYVLPSSPLLTCALLGTPQRLSPYRRVRPSVQLIDHLTYSKRAREERALAVQRRLSALQKGECESMCRSTLL